MDRRAHSQRSSRTSRTAIDGAVADVVSAEAAISDALLVSELTGAGNETQRGLVEAIDHYRAGRYADAVSISMRIIRAPAMDGSPPSIDEIRKKFDAARVAVHGHSGRTR